jgi:hypothetical protein
MTVIRQPVWWLYNTMNISFCRCCCAFKHQADRNTISNQYLPRCFCHATIRGWTICQQGSKTTRMPSLPRGRWHPPSVESLISPRCMMPIQTLGVYESSLVQLRIKTMRSPLTVQPERLQLLGWLLICNSTKVMKQPLQQRRKV